MNTDTLVYICSSCKQWRIPSPSRVLSINLLRTQEWWLWYRHSCTSFKGFPSVSSFHHERGRLQIFSEFERPKLRREDWWFLPLSVRHSRAYYACDDPSKRGHIKPFRQLTSVWSLEKCSRETVISSSFNHFSGFTSCSKPGVATKILAQTWFRSEFQST